MEARLLRTVWGLFLVYLLQAESTRVDLVPEKTQRRVEGLFLTFSGRNITVKAVYNRVLRSEQGSLTLPLTPEGQRTIYVLDTDYEHYTILKLSLLWQGRIFHVLKYFSKLSLGWGRALWLPTFRLPAQLCCAPQLGELETEDEPGFWRFRDMTADQGLYMLTRHGRCAELLREVSLLLLVYIAA
ncbi:hypothetical protein U0070_022890 [Myodes glareolus]|uniref:Uncharacterized protein n=1 Tax=Myodes glareolus TaxID=447135 RepID=A0AAW0GVU3_MYOGA